jgi:hypothetical protein
VTSVAGCGQFPIWKRNSVTLIFKPVNHYHPPPPAPTEGYHQPATQSRGRILKHTRKNRITINHLSRDKTHHLFIFLIDILATQCQNLNNPVVNTSNIFKCHFNVWTFECHQFRGLWVNTHFNSFLITKFHTQIRRHNFQFHGYENNGTIPE